MSLTFSQYNFFSHLLSDQVDIYLGLVNYSSLTQHFVEGLVVQDLPMESQVPLLQLAVQLVFQLVLLPLLVLQRSVLPQLQVLLLRFPLYFLLLALLPRLTLLLSRLQLFQVKQVLASLVVPLDFVNPVQTPYLVLVVLPQQKRLMDKDNFGTTTKRLLSFANTCFSNFLSSSLTNTLTLFPCSNSLKGKIK